ncbi:MAG TPA: hypothetical protein VFV67_22105 [Actinophytocola sp.]|uniref:hypothetical protein n=1 Tax=Actinophytocola sp. TaxID=1872138 RepID=UPI002DB92183|nr:hypothetical protein [Actinophytocola sp.]HEU5473346.1 hypothetical protein [Actinophytocola sp.]
MLILAAAGYVFVACTGHGLPPEEANLAITFYFLANIVGPGIFGALEQVANRSTSRALTGGLSLGAELHRVRRAGIGLAAVVTALLVLLAPILGGRTLHGDWGLYCLVLAIPVINAAQHRVRGQLVGLGRLDRFGGMLAVEGIARVLFCIPLLCTGVGSAWVYGSTYLAATAVALLVGTTWLRTELMAEPGRATPGTAHPVGRSLAALSCATLFAQMLPNIAPLAVSSQLAPDSTIALAFGHAVVVARIPVLLFFPITTVLTSHLTAAVTRREFAVVGRTIRLALAAIAGIGLVGTILFVLVGNWVLRTFMSSPVSLSGPTMTLLAASTMTMVAAAAVQPGLIALGRDKVVTFGWALGSASTLAWASLPQDPVDAAAVGQVIGPGLTLLLGLLGIRAGLRDVAVAVPTPPHTENHDTDTVRHVPQSHRSEVHLSQRPRSLTADSIAAAATIADAPDPGPLARLQVPRPVDRHDYVRERCAGLRVLDLGAYDETEVDRAQHKSWRWLHAEIASVAREVLGVDSSERLRASGSGGIDTRCGSRIVYGEVENLGPILEKFQPDLIVAGELIEHTHDTLGWLRQIGHVAPGTPLIATTPNTTSMINLVLALLGRESAHPDHLQVYSFRTLATLAGRVPMYDVSVRTYYYDPHTFVSRVPRLAIPLVAAASTVLRLTQFLFPMTAGGLILEGTVGRPADCRAQNAVDRKADHARRAG